MSCKLPKETIRKAEKVWNEIDEFRRYKEGKIKRTKRYGKIQTEQS